LDDGRYNLLLHGVRRAAIVREFPPEQPFRLAEVAVLEDVYSSSGATDRARVQRELLRAFQQLVPDSPQAHQQIEQLLGQQMSLGALTDIVTYTLPLDLDFKQQLLAESNVDVRSSLLLTHMRELAIQQPDESDPPFPPEFSSN
jgi:ATP-dependent Lon protease